MADPAHSRRLFFIAAALLLIGAAFLRLYQIDRRPFHADEAVQAYQTWRLLRGEGYVYDPADRHGPFLYYAAAGIAKICGWSPAALNETRLRSVTLVAGLGTIALIIGAAARIGRGAVLIGAALLAVAPLAIIFDTYFVQEAWFCFFTWALFFAAPKRVDPTCRAGACAVPRPPQAEALQDESRVQARSHSSRIPFASAVLIGALVGLMQATKETSVLHFTALGAALIVGRWSALTPTRLFRSALRPAHWGQSAPPASAAEYLVRRWRTVVATILTAVLVYVLFYSSFFTHWAGVIDGLRTYSTYAARASGSAHDQPWFYYFYMLWPHSSAGIRWGEPLFLLCALAGAIFAFSSRAHFTQRALAIFTLSLLLIYSFIPYKTPWLLLTPYVGLALLAGLGAMQAGRRLPAKLARIAPLFLCLALLLECAWVDRHALARYANDERNPYVYQPTSTDLARLVARIAAQPANMKIAVVSPDHAWPLPWYLRDRAATGYFATPPANLSDYDLVLLDSRLDLPSPERFSAFGLRPNVILWCETAQLDRN